MADTTPDLDQLIAWATAVIAEGLISPDLHKTGRILLGLDVDPPVVPAEVPPPV